MINLALKQLVSLSALVLLVGCSSDKQPRTFGGISNRGLLPLSTTNSSLGANDFLSRELGKSEALKGFVTSRGAPHAIKVQEHKVRPTDMSLYYPRENSFYIAELNSTLLNYDWIVRGPFKVSDFENQSLKTAHLELEGEPLLRINGVQTRVKATPPVTKDTTTKVAPSLVVPPHLLTQKTPSAAPKIAPTPVKKNVTPTPKPTPLAKKAEPSPTPFKPLNYDQMAILMSQGFAERDTNGDVIHTVNSANETLEKITTWYTGAKGNLESVAKASGIDGSKSLTLGERIRVPYSLVKNTKQMK